MSFYKAFFNILQVIFFCLPSKALDQSLRPPADSTKQVSSVYQDMIVVQRRAKEKAHAILLSTYLASEFSDGPEAIYAVNFDFGYAISDEFEVNFNVAPFFVTQDLQIKKDVANLNLANGQKATLNSPKSKLQYGLEALWLPAYGKDSWGPFHIVRSDTFFKVYLGNIQYDTASGFRLTLGVGKTFFLSRYFNPRFSAAFGLQQSIINDQKSTTQVGLFEAGSIWYF